MFQNMLMTGVTPLANINEAFNRENRPFATFWPTTEHGTTGKSKNETIKRPIMKKKNKRYRTAYTTEQLLKLEHAYQKQKYIDAITRKQLSSEMNIGERSLKIWFQNRRMKEKRENAETSDSRSDSVPTESPLVHCHKVMDRLYDNRYEAPSQNDLLDYQTYLEYQMYGNPFHVEGNATEIASVNEIPVNQLNVESMRKNYQYEISTVNAIPVNEFNVDSTSKNYEYDLLTYPPPYPKVTSGSVAFCGKDNTVYSNYCIPEVPKNQVNEDHYDITDLESVLGL